MNIGEPKEVVIAVPAEPELPEELDAEPDTQPEEVKPVEEPQPA